MIVKNQNMRIATYYLISMISLPIVGSACQTNRDSKESNLIETNPDLLVVKTNSKRQNALPHPLKFSKIVTDYEVIPLETNENSVIKMIGRIILLRSFLLVQDSRNRSLLLFDKSGEFQRKIGSKGKGPGEFTRITDIDVDHKNNLIFVYDQKQGKLITFDTMGVLMTEQKVFHKKGMISSIKHIEKNRFLTFLEPKYNKSTKSLAYFENQKFSMLETNNMKSIHINQYFSGSNELIRSGESIVFCPRFGNVIYTIDNQNISPRILLNPDEKTMSHNEISTAMKMAMKQPRPSDRSMVYTAVGQWGMTHFIETRAFITFRYHNPDYPTSKFALVDKTTTPYNQNCYLHNDIHTEVSPSVDIKYADDSTFINLVYGLDDDLLVKNQKEQIAKDEHMSSEIKSRVSKLDMNSNPLLLVYHLKQTQNLSRSF